MDHPVYTEELLGGFQCPVCLCIPVEPVRNVSCGHRYCRSCLQMLTLVHNQDRCVYCRQEGLEATGLLAAEYRVWAAIEVYCLYADEGCDRLLFVWHYASHVRWCVYVSTVCPLGACHWSGPAVRYPNHRVVCRGRLNAVDRGQDP